MAEFEVNAHLEGETDIDVKFNKFSIRDKLRMIVIILLGGTICFQDTWVELEGETYVEIEPQERY